MRALSISLVFCLVSLLTGCVGDELMSDPIMSATVNGRDFTACTMGQGKNPVPGKPTDKVRVTYQEASGQLLIIGTDDCNDSARTVYIDLRDVRGPGRFVVNHQSALYYNPDDTPGSGAGNNAVLKYLGRHPANSAGVFSTDARHTGVVDITAFDLQTRRLSATFELDVYGQPSEKVFKIRNGQLKDVGF